MLIFACGADFRIVNWQVDATPFRQWYVTHYGQELGEHGLSITFISGM